ncbi:MAG: hypothetical protein ACREP9_01635 [Candidatus Dormibacteraceae bacterium]
MAIQPDFDSWDQEILEVLESNPGLLEELQAADQLADSGQLPLVPREQARQRLEWMGLLHD